MTPFTQFIKEIISPIVDYPDQIFCEQTLDERGVLVTLTVHPQDMGKVIGREGRTAESIRVLLRVVGAKHNAKVSLKINNPITQNDDQGSQD